MNLTIEVPDELGQALAAQSGTASRAVLERAAITYYRPGVITTAQVQQMLGLESRWDTEAFLKRAGADIPHTVEDLEEDAAVMKSLKGK